MNVKFTSTWVWDDLDRMDDEGCPLFLHFLCKLLQDQGEGMLRSPGWRSRMPSPVDESALLFSNVTLISSVQ